MAFSRTMLAAGVALLLSEAAALAQPPPLDASDPAITEKPMVDLKKIRIPKYPQAARTKREEGETTINTCISASGQLMSAKLSKSSGHKLLDDATLEWVTGAKFKPGKAEGKAVDVCNYLFTYVWTLSSSAPETDFSEYSRISEGDRPVLLTRATQPVYPASSLAAGVSGVVKVELCIGPDGRVAALYKNPIGGDDALVKATLSMALTSTYSPGKKRGDPYQVCGLPFEHNWVLPQ